MTTIVYKNGVMAGDSRAFTGTSIKVGSKSKVYKLQDGRLLGVSSNTPGACELIVAWVADGARRKRAPVEHCGDSFDVLLIGLDGAATLYSDSFNPIGPVSAPYFAIGSGAQIALGAMAMGADPVQAVEVAIMHDAWSAAPIYMVQSVIAEEIEHIQKDNVAYGPNNPEAPDREIYKDAEYHPQSA